MKYDCETSNGKLNYYCGKVQELDGSIVYWIDSKLKLVKTIDGVTEYDVLEPDNIWFHEHEFNQHMTLKGG